MNPDTSHQAAYWSSFSMTPNTSEPYGFRTTANRFLISVILDAGSWSHFSGIQIVVIYKESERTQDVVRLHGSIYHWPKTLTDVAKKIKDLLHTWKFKYAIKEPHGIRDVFVRHRNIVEQSKHISNRSHGHDIPYKDLPICTVVFELVDVSTAATHLVDLVPRRNTAQLDDIFRIGYTRTYPCTQTSHSVRLHLVTNILFPVTQSARPRRRGRCPYFHSLRILPIHCERPPFVKFPPNIITQIASYAISGQAPWRSTLASLSLVCKSWSHVTDLFFRRYTSTNDDKPTAIAVARSLESRPERGQLIRQFHTKNYYQNRNEDNEEHLGRCIALLRIITLATSITDVIIRKIHASALEGFVHGLSQLRKVERLTAHGSPPKDLKPLDPIFRVDDVQTFIAKWPCLQEMNLSYWSNET